jgi:hypothetical protein
MTTPETQPRQQYVIHGSWTLNRILIFIGAVLFFIAAIVVDGANVLNTPAWSWAFWGFSAWLLAGAV